MTESPIYRTIRPGMTAISHPPSWLDSKEHAPPPQHLLPPEDSISKAIQNLAPDLLISSENILEAKIRERDGSFNRTLGMIKILFWDEYRRSLSQRVPMDSEVIWNTLVTERWWVNNVLRDPLNLAWIITPPAEEALVKREMLTLGLKRLREAMELPFREKVKQTVIGEDGVKKTVYVWQTNVPLIKEVHAIVKTLQDRVHGAVAQHHSIVQKNLNVNLQGSTEDLPRLDDSFNLNMEQLDQYAEKLKLIESKIKDIAVVDGEYIERTSDGEGSSSDSKRIEKSGGTEGDS